MLSWSIDTVPANNLLLMQPMNAMRPIGNIINMANVSQLEISQPGELEITYSSIEPSAPIILNSGWNHISLNVIPADPSPVVVFSGLTAGVLKQIVGQNSNFNPSLPAELNTLPFLEPGVGYWINVTSDSTIFVLGQQQASDSKLRLEAGWNNVAFIQKFPVPARVALRELITSPSSNLIRVLNREKSFDPALPDPQNTLTVLHPGNGYWVKVNNEQLFSFRQQ